jgi:hypothetical protein
VKIAPLVRNGITLLSGQEPERRCERVAQAVPVTQKTLYLCPSPLYGYGLKELLARLENEAPDSAVLCIEADPELLELTGINIDKSLLAGNKLRLTNETDISKLCAFVRGAWGVMAFRKIEIVKLTGGWQLFGSLYDSLCDALRREIATDWSNALTLTKLGRLYIRNALRNLCLADKFPSVAQLSFGDSPVLVLGAGPSLDETLDALEKRSYKPADRPFKIICVDTCLGALKDRNIVPDLVVILESQHWNMRDFIGCAGWKIPVAFDFSALPGSAGVLGGEGFLFMTPWTELNIFKRFKNAGIMPDIFPPLGSVGLTATELARRITAGKIICAGLDFSFTPEKYHARGTAGHKSRLNRQNRLRGIANTAAYSGSSVAAVSKAGARVCTNPAMRNYRELFENEFAPDGRIFDIAGSGLPLGVKTLSMDEAMEILVSREQGAGSREQRAESREQRAESKEIKDRVEGFIREEKERLEELRGVLTGAAGQERLDVLINECDYLWGHFPDFAGGRRPDLAENERSFPKETLSFLNRVRTEIDPMIKLLERVWV